LVHLHWVLGNELIIVSVGRLLANCSELKVLIYKRLQRGWEFVITADETSNVF